MSGVRGFVLAAALAAAAGGAWATDYFVRPDGSDANTGTGNTAAQAFLTVQRGVNACAPAGDRVLVAPGAYVEQVTIRDKALEVLGGITMPGIGAGATVVRMPAGGRVADPSMRTSNTTPPIVNTANQADPTIWVEDTTPATSDVRVNLADLTVDGASLGATALGPVFAGIVYRACKGLIRDCVIENYQDNPPNGAQRGAGIWVDGLNPPLHTATDVTMLRCTIRNVQKGLIVIKVGRGHVTNCSLTGYGPVPFIAQNGIQFSSGADGTADGSTICGFEFDPPGSPDPFASAGVVVFGPTGPLSLAGNYLAGCDVGVYVEDAFGVVGATRVAGNTVSACADVGVYTDAEGGRYEGNALFDPKIGGDAAGDDGTPPNVWTGNQFHDLVAPGARAIPGSPGTSDAGGRPTPNPFGPSVPLFPGGVDPRGIVARDLNADGRADLAFVTSGGNTVEVRYGDGTGGFTRGESVSLPAASIPVALASGLLDAGATVDLAVACENGTVVTLLNDGTGPAWYPAAGIAATITGAGIVGTDRPAAIAVGTVDGVNQDDLLVALAGSPPFFPGGARLLLNDGTGGTFVGSNPFGVISSAQGCALADLDADGDLDAVVSDAGLIMPSVINNVKVFQNTGGTFAAGPVLTAGTGPRGNLCADLDDDGRPEIVQANFGNPFASEKGSVSVFRNTSSGGISFATPSTTECDYGTMAVSSGDAFADTTTGSPHRDVAAVNYGADNVTVLVDWCSFTIGSGGFAFLRTLTGVDLPAGTALADFNGDGAADLTVTNLGTDDLTKYNGVVRALLTFYGLGCRGTAGRIPAIGVEGGLPLQPNLLFAITVSNALPNAGALLAASLGRVDAPGCSLLLASIDLLLVTYTAADGTARFPIPIPETPTLTGTTLYWQWGIFDPNGEFPPPAGGLVSLSNAVCTRLGE